MVLQEAILFTGTVAENIAYGRSERHARGDYRRGDAGQRA